MLWALAGGVLLVAAIFGCIYLAALACIISAGAAVAHIKTYLCEQSAGFLVAYELGREMRDREGGRVPLQRV